MSKEKARKMVKHCKAAQTQLIALQNKGDLQPELVPYFETLIASLQFVGSVMERGA